MEKEDIQNAKVPWKTNIAFTFIHLPHFYSNFRIRNASAQLRQQCCNPICLNSHIFKDTNAKAKTVCNICLHLSCPVIWNIYINVRIDGFRYNMQECLHPPACSELIAPQQELSEDCKTGFKICLNAVWTQHYLRPHCMLYFTDSESSQSINVLPLNSLQRTAFWGTF